MDIRKKGNGEYKPAKASAPIGKRTSSESVIDRILGCLILSALLLLLGLIHVDQWSFRGFPFGWYHTSGEIRYESMFASFAALLAVVTGAFILSAVIGRIKEPSLRTMSGISSAEAVRANTPAYEPKEVKTGYPRETVKTASSAVKKPAVRKPDGGEDSGLSKPHKEIRSLLDSAVNTASEDEEGPKKSFWSLIAFVIGLAVIIIPVLIPDDSPDDYYYDDDDTVLEYSAYDEARYKADEAIEWLQDGDEDALSSVGDVPSELPLEYLANTTGSYMWDYFPSDDMEDRTQAVFRYVLFGYDYDEDEDEVTYDDEEDPVYLVAVLIEGDDLTGYPEEAYVSGISVY